MALETTTITVTPTASRWTSRTRTAASFDTTDATAELVAATVVLSDDDLRQAGATAHAKITAGVIALVVDGPVGVGSVDVVVAYSVA